MPLIPGVNEREVTPTAADTPYFKIDATADEFGAGLGKSAQGFATSLLDSVQPASKLVKKLTETPQPKGDDGYHIDLPMPQFSPDLSKAIEATNNFDAGAQGLQSNFLQLSGKDAVDGQAAAQQGIDRLKDDTLANAPTPAAADAARPAIAYRADAAKAVIDRHATSQQRVYDDDLDDTQVAQGRNSVGQLYNDDTNYLAQLHVATQARADQVLRAAANDNAPADPDNLAAAIASARQATASDYTRARIEGALEQGDVATATALTDRWGDDLLPVDKDAVEQHLTYAGFNQDSQQATTQAMAINQPAPSNTPLGRQRNADMVLHRSGGAGTQPNGTNANGEDTSSGQAPETDEPSVKILGSSIKLDGTANHAEFGKGRSNIPSDPNEPPTFTFYLNGRNMTSLQDENGKSFAAFSGNGSAANDPTKTADENVGPLPKGTYYIVARQSGGLLGSLRDFAHKHIPGNTDKAEWFSLYRADNKVDDQTTIDDVVRGAFRLHPKGPLGLSEGCITVDNKADFDQIRQQLLSGRTRLIPGTNIPYYGTVLVK